MQGSSGSTGFFQASPELTNAFDEDVALGDIYELYFPTDSTTKESLSSFGRRVVQPDLYELIADSETHPPRISTHSTFGVPRSELHTSHGWQKLQQIGIQEGMVAAPYEAEQGHQSRLMQFLRYHLWTASSAIVTCPSAMTDGAASLLRRHLAAEDLDADSRTVFGEAYRRLTSRNPNEAWTSGQWMTERSGGSDVRGTETVAKLDLHSATETDAVGLPLGPYLVTGFKWFSSATDANVSVLLARTDKGLSAFLAPLQRTGRDGEVLSNGVHIQRLKPKMGTRALPTAELVLTGMRAWLVGKEGDGVKEISTILNITRIHNTISATGFWGRGLMISRAYAQVRKVEGRLLRDTPAHCRALAKNAVQYAGYSHLGFFCVFLLGVAEQPRCFERSDMRTRLISSVEEASALLRLLTPVAKATCSKAAIWGLQECMESLGGVGYLEDEQQFNVARLFRDCNVLSIWEGTTDVMASDVVRVVKGRAGDNVQNLFKTWVDRSSSRWDSGWEEERSAIRSEIRTLIQQWSSRTPESLRAMGREAIWRLSWIVGAVLLIESATASRSGSSVDTKMEMARRWVRKEADAGDVESALVWDRKIAMVGEDKSKARL